MPVTVATHASSVSDRVKQRILRVQEYTLLSAQAIANLFHYPRYIADTMVQADSIGVGSLPIVLLTGAAVGAELALNSASTLEKFGELSQIAPLVSEGMIRELGPVITALMVAGRNASGMASELGSMRVTDQIDAMRALGTDPSKKLVSPRVVATVFMLFWRVIIANFVGLLAGALIATSLYRMDWHQYLDCGLADSRLQGPYDRPCQAAAFWVPHRNGWLFLRDDNRGRDGGSGPVDDTSRGNVLRTDPHHGFTGDEVLDDILRSASFPELSFFRCMRNGSRTLSRRTGYGSYCGNCLQ